MILLYILCIPLISSIFASFYAFSPRIKALGFICSYLMLLSFVCSLIILPSFYVDFNIHAFDISLLAWLPGAPLGFRIDASSAAMMSVVTGVATCVHFYSIYYMEHDEKFNKFFAFLGLFVFSMLILVMSNNLLFMFVGWEGVGLCSWMLIGFWYHNASFSRAANEAFIMNRISDFAMLLGIFIIYSLLGSLKFDDIISAIQAYSFSDKGLPSEFAWAAGLLFVGAMGKSAQFPFNTWLANAMAGPTPVSALIHAATMVTAGVFLLIRLSPLYSALPELSLFIAGLGAFVAIFAASMALAARDLKRIVAFSTLSQLGYMFAACGMGAYKIALFHLVTHAFFKALLFLGSGNVMHAMHDELDIFKMGGLSRTMKTTLVFMIIGSLALSGIWPLAGFFSKDAILSFAYTKGHLSIYGVLLIAAFFTAFYSFRLIMLVFFGQSRSDLAKHTHEASFIAKIAMLPLVILAIISGFLFEHKFIDLHFKDEVLMIAISLIVAIAGIIAAIFMYKNFKKERSNGLIKLLANEYFQEKFYNRVIVRLVVLISLIFAAIEWCIYNLFFSLVPALFAAFNRLKSHGSGFNLANSAFIGFFALILALVLIFASVVIYA